MIRLHPAHSFRFIVVAFALLAATLPAAERLTLNFNPDWRFIKDDPAGASAPGFDDKGWTVAPPRTLTTTPTRSTTGPRPATAASSSSGAVARGIGFAGGSCGPNSGSRRRFRGKNFRVG